MNFTILNEIDRCKTAAGNYTIGIFDVSVEDYATLAEIMPILREIEKITTIVIDDKTYKIKYANGGDLKYLANIYGILFKYSF